MQCQRALRVSTYSAILKYNFNTTNMWRTIQESLLILKCINKLCCVAFVFLKTSSLDVLLLGSSQKTYILVWMCMLSRGWLFCDPADCILLGSSVHGILQARILEWVAVSFSRILVCVNTQIFKKIQTCN